MARYEVKKGSFGEIPTYELTDAVAHVRAVVVPAVGSNMIALRYGESGASILHEPPSPADLVESPKAYGFPVLMPPNRIASARFEIDGREYVFPANEGCNHIHGLVHSVEWEVMRQHSSDRDGAVLETTVDSLDYPVVNKVYPQHFRLTMKYVLHEGDVTVSTRCENLSDPRLPFGIGFHPYFRTPMAAAGTKDSCFVRLPAGERWILRDCFPTGDKVEPAGEYDLREFRSMASLKLDDLFGSVPGQTAVLEDRGSRLRLTVEASETYPFWVIWTGKTADAPFICLEPYSCVTNAFNLDMDPSETGLRLLERGEVFSGSIKLAVRTM